MMRLPSRSLGFREFFCFSTPGPAAVHARSPVSNPQQSTAIHTTAVLESWTQLDRTLAGFEFLVPMVCLGSASCDPTWTDHPKITLAAAISDRALVAVTPEIVSQSRKAEFYTGPARTGSRAKHRAQNFLHRIGSYYSPLITWINLPLRVKLGRWTPCIAVTRPLPWLPHLDSYLLAPRSLPCFSSIPDGPNVSSSVSYRHGKPEPHHGSMRQKTENSG